ncbi:MAG: hypothetical protein Q9210_006057 [Variospora velana]
MPSRDSKSSCRSTHSVGSNISPTSTDTYEQVPYAQYIPAVRELCQKLWPSASGEFVLERLKGGSFNRVIGITAPDPVTRVPTKYVLRISRFLYARPDCEVAIHRYVQEHTPIPTADIFFSDPTTANPLEMPYVVQARLPGVSLCDGFDVLNHDQRKDVVQQWARIILAEQAVKSITAGVVEATDGPDGTRTYNVRLWVTEPETRQDSSDFDPASDRNVLKMFLTQFKRCEMADLHRDKSGDGMCEYYYALLSNVAIEMDDAGLFSDNDFHLCHCDLEPRNVMVEVHDDESAEIVGVLDWDSAAFAPIFVSCKPPWWIWTWTNEEDEVGLQSGQRWIDWFKQSLKAELKANDTPVDPENQELKTLFEDIVGPVFTKYAYEHEYHLARRLFALASTGLRGCGAIDDADDIMEEWATLKAQKNFPMRSLTGEGNDMRELRRRIAEACALW